MIKQLIAATSVAACCLFNPAGMPEAEAASVRWKKACSTRQTAVVIDFIDYGYTRVMLHESGKATFNPNGRGYDLVNTSYWEVRNGTVYIPSPYKKGVTIKLYNAANIPCHRYF